MMFPRSKATSWKSFFWVKGARSSCAFRLASRARRRARFGSSIGELFHFLDRDKQEKLNDIETANVPAPQSLLQFIQGNFQSPRAMVADPRRGPETAISLVGGKVTAQGLASFFRVSGLEPFLSYSRQTADRSKEETDALFALLDLDKDGKLTKSEVDGAVQALAKLDADDNEILSPEELFGPRPAAMHSPTVCNTLRNSRALVGLLILDAEDALSRLMPLLAYDGTPTRN